MLRVLVPVDGSAHDAKTLQFLQKLLGGRSDLEVLIVHAVDLHLLASSGADVAGMPVFLLPGETEAQQKEALGFADKIVTGAAAEAQRLGLKTRSVVRWGSPAAVIVEAAHDEQDPCDLIAMGSRGAGQIAGIFLGSVSDRVAHRAGIPVLIVH